MIDAMIARLPGIWLKRLAAGEVTAAHLAHLAPYCNRRELLRKIDADYRQCRWAWMTTDDFRRGVASIVRKWERPKVRK